MTKFQAVFEDYRAAVQRLQEVLALEKNEVIRDSAIKRFEIAFELAWKTTKAFLEGYHSMPFHRGVVSKTRSVRG